LPAVLQLLLSGWQVPLHTPLQQSPFAEQVFPSDVQAVAAQNPLAPHCKEQQSVGAAQGVPCEAHLPTTEAQVCDVPSHKPEQQEAPFWQTALKTPQEMTPPPDSAAPAPSVEPLPAPAASPVAPSFIGTEPSLAPAEPSSTLVPPSPDAPPVC
jgi:hypothetical protein